MKVGIAMNMLYEHGRPDVAVVHEHFQSADLVEPLKKRSGGKVPVAA